MKLNGEQEISVQSENPYTAVIAGPGTGKTRTLVARIEFLLKDKKVSSDKIVALTFTRKAALEIKERLSSPVGFVGTFHALALHLLKITPSIITSEQQLKLLSKEDLQKVSISKNNLEESDLVKVYNQKLKELGLVDYDDLLVLLLDKLKGKELKCDFEHILVDEFQDTNKLQYEILKSLKAKNHFIIGDPKQSIYSFRGTNEKAFLQFFNDNPSAKKITLKQNYRSAQGIVSLFESLYPKIEKLKVEPGISAEVVNIKTLNPYTEAEFVVSHIKKQVGGISLEEVENAKAEFSSFAVLYRTHYLKNLVEKKLRSLGIPFQVVGGGSLYEDEEIKKVIESICIRLSDGLVLPVASLLKEVEQQAKVHMLPKSKLDELVSLVFRFEKEDKPIEAFLGYFDTISEQEYYDPNLNCVTLLTIHSAKGLEFDSVFVCGFEEGIIPLKGAELEEEKRLLYVALSRAKRNLYLLTTNKRSNKKVTESQFTSFFNNNLITKLKDPNTLKVKERMKKRILKKAQKTLF